MVHLGVVFVAEEGAGVPMIVDVEVVEGVEIWGVGVLVGVKFSRS